MRRLMCWLCLVAGCIYCPAALLLSKETVCACADEDISDLRPVAAVEPEDAAATVRAVDRFRLELLAAEPRVTDPVAMAYDANGRAYVVEMRDYPYMDPALDEAWAEQKSPPGGRVRLLYDDDGDGRFERSTVFADALSWPTGVACWRGGVYVSATPAVWYLKDTDGDGVADVRRKVFDGFRKYNVQAVANNLKWGMDQRIYGAGSSNGGMIARVGEDDGAEPVRLGRNDFRFDPVDERLEVLSGGARFGNSFDDWGNRFICNLRNPLQHVVLPAEYLHGNPFFAAARAVADVAVAGDAVPVYRASPAEAWRVENARRLAADASRKSPRSEQVATGYVTSASGITIYRGDAYPEEYYGSAFVGEPAGNLMIRYKLDEAGATFRGERPEVGEDFLASTDNWFRPVNFANAPDGTLTVLDMYRETIEHPWSIPDDLKAKLDLRSGSERGRIYRLVPARYREGYTRPAAPRLGEATTEELVEALGSPNAWWRETAARLLSERQDKSAVAGLRATAREHVDPRSRAAAVWALAGLRALQEQDVLVALVDEAAGVRVQGVRLAERFLASDAVVGRVLTAADDASAAVRFRAALALGRLAIGDANRRERIAAALARIAKRDTDDEWAQAAVLTGAVLTGENGCAGPMLARLVDDARFCERVEGRQTLEVLAATAAGAAKVETVAKLIGRPVGEETAWAMTLGLARGSRGNEVKVIERAGSEGAAALERVFAGAARVAADRAAEAARRVRATEVVAAQMRLRHDAMTAAEALIELVTVDEPTAVQLAAVEGLASAGNAQVAERVLARYSGLSPAVRTRVVESCLGRAAWLGLLLEAVEAGTVSPAAVPEVHRQRLKKHRDAAIREQASRLFVPQVREERAAVIARYETAISGAESTGETEIARGEAVFRRECAACHRYDNEGHEVGPNLATIRNRTAGEVLLHVLDPNREVAPLWQQYVVVTTEGVVKTGIIAAETATAITFRQAEGRQETVPRDEIETMESTGKSLMPEGMETKITPAEMRDLMWFLLPPQ